MRRVLITGINSYIGLSVKRWLGLSPKEYNITNLSLKQDSWKEKDFSSYDVVLHVAGIAHVSADPKLEELYYKVNTELTYEIAKKSKREGVKQFIFLSSIIVYGSQNLDNGLIDKKTIPKPDNFYGNSKLQAEIKINELNDEYFKIAILRPPMIYGKGSKGNYWKLSQLAKRTPVFPDYNNIRSMLHIDNLCEFIRLIIDNQDTGLFFPQNNDYVKTSELVQLIAEINNNKVHFTKIGNPLINLFKNKVLLSKLFGDLAYSKEISYYKQNYIVVENLRDSIILTEK